MMKHVNFHNCTNIAITPYPLKPYHITSNIMIFNALTTFQNVPKRFCSTFHPFTRTHLQPTNATPMPNLNLTCSPLFFVIAGPCVIESPELCLQIATHVKAVCEKLGLDYVFKASFDKANRSSNASFRGPGMKEGLAILDQVKKQVGVPVLTDVHEPDQAAEAGKVVDILQVPAFLARQTDLLMACGQTGKTINVKKGQFMSPQEMGLAIEKIKSTGNENILLTERGTFFGYNRLVNDFTGLAVMKSFNVPVVFDITHSTQQPAGLGKSERRQSGVFADAGAGGRRGRRGWIIFGMPSRSKKCQERRGHDAEFEGCRAAADLLQADRGSP